MLYQDAKEFVVLSGLGTPLLVLPPELVPVVEVEPMLVKPADALLLMLKRLVLAPFVAPLPVPVAPLEPLAEKPLPIFEPLPSPRPEELDED